MISILQNQLDWFWILFAGLFAGLFAALGFSLAEAIKPRFETVKGEDGKEKKILKEKAGIITKAELLGVGTRTLQGAFYGVVITVILMVLSFTPLNTTLQFIFGQPLSVQFTAAACAFVIIAISMGLHVEAWKEGGMFAAILVSLKSTAKSVTETVKGTGESLVTSTVKLASEKVEQIAQQAEQTIQQAANQAEEAATDMQTQVEAEQARIQAEIEAKKAEMEQLNQEVTTLKEEPIPENTNTTQPTE